jgi:hypothetical protein
LLARGVLHKSGKKRIELFTDALIPGQIQQNSREKLSHGVTVIAAVAVLSSKEFHSLTCKMPTVTW